ncbi:gtfA, partial [Symbiodinium sp. CCMP2456]
FGNALIEAFYYRKPVLVNRYSIFVSDIEPKGFKVITMNGYMTRDVVQKVRAVIDDPEYREQMVEHNYELGKRFFSYAVLRRKLRALVTNGGSARRTTNQRRYTKHRRPTPPDRHLRRNNGLSLADRVTSLTVRLRRIYGDRADEALRAMEAEFADLSAAPTDEAGPRWNERDVVLITYADQLRSDEGAQSPLVALREWLVENGLEKVLSTVHLLPFCPYSSDDGFSVIDYLAVDPDSGTWEDIAALGEPFELMFDLVLNHISQHSEWYAAYKRGESPYDRFFIEADPALDYTQVTRPRSLPLLTAVETSRGPRHVWTTFSDDQIDLNYGEPLVLARMLRILVEYAMRGARIVRLDAITYLWKRLGTTCVHLPETHEVVKLMRDVLAAYSPRTLVLTETNVPHVENISYFGQLDPRTGEADEAHMVYQFSLPPLLLEAFLSGDATALRDWLTNLDPPPPGCT